MLRFPVMVRDIGKTSLQSYSVWVRYVRFMNIMNMPAVFLKFFDDLPGQMLPENVGVPSEENVA